MEQEALHLDMGDYRVTVPEFMKEVIAEITHHARQSPDVNQRSGVSVRASVANYEALLANAFRRALRVGETEVVPRVSDLPFIVPSLQGKVEFEAMEDGQETRIMDRLIQGAVKSVFDRKFDINDVEEIAAVFNNGLSVEVGEGVASRDYGDILSKVDGLAEVIGALAGESEAARATAIEFVLEGLHLHKLLNKYSVDGRASYMG